MAPEVQIADDPRGWARCIAAIAAHQDRAAFAELFSFFAPRLKTFMQRSGMSESRAEELAQEALLLVWRKAGLFDPAKAGAAAWIFTIARNLRTDVYRRERVAASATHAFDAEAEYQIDETPLPDTAVAAVQSEVIVRQALSRLTPEQLQVVELSFFEDRAHGEIASTLGIPLGTVKSRLRLALKRLRTLLDELS